MNGMLYTLLCRILKESARFRPVPNQTAALWLLTEKPNANFHAIIMGGSEMVLERVREIISSQFGIDEDQITEDTDIIDDLGADSLDVMEMMMSLEDEFSLSISEDTVSSLSTVGDVVRLIEGLM